MSRHTALSKSLMVASAFFAVTMAVLVPSCAEEEGDNGRPTTADCEAARANQARLVVAANARPDDRAETRAELARHEAVLMEIGGAAEIERCLKTESRSRLRCVAQARSLDEAAACSAPR